MWLDATDQSIPNIYQSETGNLTSHLVLTDSGWQKAMGLAFFVGQSALIITMQASITRRRKQLQNTLKQAGEQGVEEWGGWVKMARVVLNHRSERGVCYCSRNSRKGKWHRKNAKSFSVEEFSLQWQPGFRPRCFGIFFSNRNNSQRFDKFQSSRTHFLFNSL